MLMFEISIFFSLVLHVRNKVEGKMVLFPTCPMQYRKLQIPKFLGSMVDITLQNIRAIISVQFAVLVGGYTY